MIRPSGEDSEAQLLALIDLVDDWIADQDYNGCVITRGLSDLSTNEEIPLRGRGEPKSGKSRNIYSGTFKSIVEPAKAKLCRSNS